MIEVAWSMHVEACRPYKLPRSPHLAEPFGTPIGMPDHRWRVSTDVLQALYEASPPPIGPNPKSGDDGTTRLFGWVVERDAALPTGTMLLEPYDDR